MAHHNHRKVATAILAAALTLGGGGVAFAWFTSQGTGTGHASVGSTGVTDFVITSAGPSSSLFPGTGPVGFTVRAQNTGSADDHLDAIAIAVARDGSGNVLAAGGLPVVGCLASWFSVDSPVSVGTTVSPGAYSDAIGSTIGMADAGVNQDACQGVSVGLVLSATAGA